ncbi:MAG: phosphodiesterase [Spirochaetales bacterium]|nr:phosphodiesterase [Spirochaetales bacterium]
MNFFVISDIHGSSEALEKALEIYSKGSYRKLIICGDILYHGARNPLPQGYNPQKVIEILNGISNQIVAVRGNCESEVDSMVLNFPLKADYSYILTSNYDIFITHGHIYSPENYPKLNNGSIFLSGHTHIPVGEKNDEIHFLNPGSISLPKGGFSQSYGILTRDSWEVYDLNTEKSIFKYIL